MSSPPPTTERLDGRPAATGRPRLALALPSLPDAVITPAFADPGGAVRCWCCTRRSAGALASGSCMVRVAKEATSLVRTSPQATWSLPTLSSPLTASQERARPPPQGSCPCRATSWTVALAVSERRRKDAASAHPTEMDSTVAVARSKRHPSRPLMAGHVREELDAPPRATPGRRAPPRRGRGATAGARGRPALGSGRARPGWPRVRSRRTGAAPRAVVDGPGLDRDDRYPTDTPP